MLPEVVLALWSCAGLTWWAIALYLVSANRRKTIPVPSVEGVHRTLSVFKPLPPLGSNGLRMFSAGLHSFIAQLDSESELLLGVHEADLDKTASFVERMRTEYPKARVKVVSRCEPDGLANPKIAWEKTLAAYATGELWLWSDADIIVPPGFLQSARTEFAQNETAMMTFPYVVREISPPPTLLEALFVNVEFYPGVLLLRRCGQVDFGLGAAMLFRSRDFLEKIEWNEIGSCLADDFYLGQKLQPVRIGAATLTTVAGSPTWKAAISHDLRWARTIRWNRPGGSFARILIMPVLGWLAAVALHPGQLFAWLGFLGMVQAEVWFAMTISRRAGGRIDMGQLLDVELWSFWRIILWFASWLPWPVHWYGRVWNGQKMELKPTS